MTQKHKIQLFEDQKVRTVWDDELEEWFFSIVDVCGVLTEQKTSRGASTYWAVLKNRLAAEGADELLTNCKRLKMRAADGKMRYTDAEAARDRLESQLGHSVISPAKASDYLPPADHIQSLPDDDQED